MKDATFSAARLLELYDRISDAEDAIPRLRRLVLDLAVRGKLVEQDARDEPAVELLKRIGEEKARLVKAKEITQSKNLDQVSADDLVFDIPLHWQPAFVASVLNELQTGPFGSSLHKSDYCIGGTPVINPASLQNERIVPIEKMAVDKKTLERLASFKLRAGDIVMARRGEMGRCAIVTDLEADWLCGTGSLILRPTKYLYARFLVLVIGSPFGRQYLGRSSVGSTMQNLNQSILLKLPFGLPPLAEQHRIVAKVDELMALCDQLERARAGREAVRDRLTIASLARLTAPETDAEAFQSHARFALQSLPTLTTRPNQIKTLRQTILNLAVRGKLVEQDATDEPVAELLKRIGKEQAGKKEKTKAKGASEEPENSFEEVQPKNWAWSTLNEISLKLHYGYTASADIAKNDVRMLRITDIQDDRVDWTTVPGCEIDERNFPKYALEADDLLIARTGGTIGKTFLVSEVPVKSVFASYLIRVQPARALHAAFVKLFCGSDIYWDQLREGSRGGGQPNVNGQTLGRMQIPLPPLAEQHRIVAKVDALMALCDQLEASLTTTATTRSKLLNALLHEALNPNAEVA
jgi:type I restriction enzyme S subunit